MSVRTNASNEYLKRTTSLPSSTAFTMCGWAKMTAVKSGSTINYQYWGLEDADATSSNYLLMGYSEFTQSFEVTSSAGNSAFSVNPTDEAWLFWAMSNAGTGATDFKGYYAHASDTTFYTATTNGASFTSAALRLGNDSYGENMNAAYAYVKVYDAVLTSAELWQEMWSARPVRTNNLHIFSPLFDTNDLKDYSGNGRDWGSQGIISSEEQPPVSWAAPSIFVSKATPAAQAFSKSRLVRQAVKRSATI